MRSFIGLFLFIIIIACGGYVYWYYYNTYGDGFREGILQKFSRKGSVFKTYEGEMVLQGFGSRNGTINANYFYFSVADEKVADSLEACLGKAIRVHYRQYRRALPWRGDSYEGRNSESGQYMVDRVDQVRSVDYIY